MLWSGWWISKPQPHASKASRLPLTIHPDILVPRDGYAPSSDDYQSSVFLLNYPGKIRWEIRGVREIFSINELLFSYSYFRRQFISHPTGPTSSRNRHLSMKTRTTPGSVSHLLLSWINLVFVSLSSRYMSRSGNILPDTASQTAHRGFLRIVWWTSTVPPRVLVRAKHSCYLSTLQAQYSFIFYGAS